MDMSSGSTIQQDIILHLNQESQSLLDKAYLILVQSFQNMSDRTEKIDTEKSSSSWRKVQDIISF